MPKKAAFGFCYDGYLVLVGDVVKNRFSLNNPWVIMEIYAIDSSYCIYHVGKGNEDIWLNCHDIEFVSHMNNEYLTLLPN